MDNTQNIISFCSGYGGLDRGIELAGIKSRTVAYVEIEAFAIANLVAKMETGLLVPAPVWTNLKTFPMEAFRGRVHGITAGYPCQPFSCAGQRKGTDDPRHLWPYIRRIYQTIQPDWMFFENVEGHVTLGLSTVISDLEEDGYKVEAGLFTAAEVGAPHRRKRVFILANSRCFRPEIGQVPTAGVFESGELANPNSQREQAGRGQVYKADGEVSERNDDAEFEQSSTGVENTISFGRGRRSQGGDEVRGCGMSEDKITGSGAPSEVLADTDIIRPQGKRTDSNSSGREGQNERQAGLRHGTKWPSRPGQPQYDWEEPRVTQPGLGRAIDGSSSRVDRLRLLGNGVVPQQAARSWMTLSSLIDKERTGR